MMKIVTMMIMMMIEVLWANSVTLPDLSLASSISSSEMYNVDEDRDHDDHEDNSCPVGKFCHTDYLKSGPYIYNIIHLQIG